MKFVNVCSIPLPLPVFFINPEKNTYFELHLFFSQFVPLILTSILIRYVIIITIENIIKSISVEDYYLILKNLVKSIELKNKKIKDFLNVNYV